MTAPLAPLATEQEIKDAVWDALLHAKTNTDLTQASIDRLCKVLPQVFEVLSLTGRHAVGTKNCPVCIKGFGYATDPVTGLLNFPCKGYA